MKTFFVALLQPHITYGNPRALGARASSIETARAIGNADPVAAFIRESINVIIFPERRLPLPDDKLSPEIELEITFAAAEVIRSSGENPSVIEFGRAQRLAGRADTGYQCPSCGYWTVMTLHEAKAEIASLRAQLNEERACHDCDEFGSMMRGKVETFKKDRDKARAMKDMHKERQEEEIALRLAAEVREREALDKVERQQHRLKTQGGIIDKDSEQIGLLTERATDAEAREHAALAEVERLKAESTGRLKALEEKAAEAKAEWLRAETAEADLAALKKVWENPACGRCGGPHQFDTSVPSVIWNEVVRPLGISEYLCTSCVLREFVKAGKSFTASLYGDGFVGESIEIRVGAQEAKVARKVSEENSILRHDLAALRERLRYHVARADERRASAGGSYVFSSALRALLAAEPPKKPGPCERITAEEASPPTAPIVSSPPSRPK